MTSRSAVRLVALVLGRPDWGRAMLAEMDRVPDPQARRRFATGCVRALVLTLPTVAAAMLLSGLASVGLVTWALVRYPGLVTGAGTWLAVGAFVCVVVTYVVASAALGTRLVGSRLVAAAVASGVASACSWTALGWDASSGFPAGLPLALLVAGPAISLFIGWWATSRATSSAAGLQCVCLASLVAGLGLFLLWAGETVAFAGRPYDAGLLRDFRASGAGDLATYAVNDSLGTAMVLLLLVPLVSLASGAVGSTVASRRTRAT